MVLVEEVVVVVILELVEVEVGLVVGTTGEVGGGGEAVVGG